jgi:hypothetical protein
VCGGQIHPIAGRCKHCKSDLVAYRAGRDAQAPIALPALGHGANAHGPQPTATSGAHTNGNGYAHAHVVNGFAPPTPMMPNPPPVLGSFLPQAAVVASLPNARQASAWSRRWPIVVVVLAAIAIVVSIVMLVMPDKKENAGKPVKRGGPAPERMDTNPTNPTTPSIPNQQGAVPPDDPWGAAPSIPDPPPPPPPGDPLDPQFPGGGTSGTAAPAAKDFPKAMLTTMCDRMVSCGATSQVKQMCRQVEDMLDGQTASACQRYDRDKAGQCISALSKFPCSTAGAGFDIDQLAQLATGIPACVEACGF